MNQCESSLFNHIIAFFELFISDFYSVIDCGALPNPTNGQVVLPSTVLGSTATYSCNTGFDLVGASTRICQADSTWSEAEPSCQSESLLY